jgi:hypothetical protein
MASILNSVRSVNIELLRPGYAAVALSLLSIIQPSIYLSHRDCLFFPWSRKGTWWSLPSSAMTKKGTRRRASTTPASPASEKVRHTAHPLQQEEEEEEED